MEIVEVAVDLHLLIIVEMLEVSFVYILIDLYVWI